MMRFMICVLFLLMFPFPAKAAEYPAGSIGYVYERCRADLKNSRSEDVFQKTYCGQFFAGFIPAVIGSNWILLVSVPEDAPCKEELEKAHEFVNGGEKAQKENVNQEPPDFFWFVNLFENIELELEKRGKKEEAFSQPVVMSWKYLSALFKGNKVELKKESKYQIHPDLVKDMKNINNIEKAPNMCDFWGCAFTIKETYDLCLADLIKARGSEERFSESVCGAGILGVLSGMLSIKRMELRPPVEGECKATIDKFFKQFEIKEKLCLTEKLRAIDAASVFIEAADKRFLKSKNKTSGIDKSELISPASIITGALGYKTACEWKNLPPFDYNKYRTYNE